jgi:CubicO group peptidase (beta-lactamase class C family)
MKKFRLGAIIIILLLGFGFLFFSCGKTKKIYYPDDNWRTSTPEEQGVDSKKILEMFQYIQSSTLDFHSLLIIRNGSIITEAYWPPYHKDTLHNIKSASKSIISALAGIAFEKKYLHNPYQKVSEFYPELTKDSLKQTISLQDLLTMTGGFDYMEDAGPSPYDLDNWKKIPMRDKPGEVFEYNTMLPHMMSAILTKATGASTKTFADKWLFGPLGITNYQWIKSNDGIYHGGSDIFLTPCDMAKFGYLFLRNGQWKGKQIVSKEWIKESTTKQVNIPAEDLYAEGLNYGYWWWLMEKGYMAWGAGGQYIIVRPDLDLVVVFTANGFDDINRYSAFMKSFLEKYIYSAIKSRSQLSPNHATVKQLNRIIQNLEYPTEKLVNSMPEIAAQISDTKYSLVPNNIGLTASTLIFKDSNECIWEYSIGRQLVHLQVGINGLYKINEIPFSMGVHPDKEEIACKGHWKDNKTFVIEHHIIGDPTKQIFELSFNEKNIEIKISTYGLNIVIKGIKEK